MMVLESVISDLRTLGLNHMSDRLEELVRSPEFPEMGTAAVLRNILDPEFEVRTSKSLEWRLRRAHLIGCAAAIENCGDSLERTYSPHGVDEVLASLKFIQDGLNICSLGGSGSGKTYFVQALGVQACYSGRAEYCHCDTLLDELLSLRTSKTDAHRKRLRSLIRIPLLILDDFLLYATTSGEQHRELFALLEGRKEAHHSTIICSQRNPTGWAAMLGDHAIADAITARVTSAYVVKIDERLKRRCSSGTSYLSTDSWTDLSQIHCLYWPAAIYRPAAANYRAANDNYRPPQVCGQTASRSLCSARW